MKSSTGDSTFCFSYPKGIEASFINTSHCYGLDGASSIAIDYFKENLSIIKFLNVVDCSNHNSIEIESSTELFLSYSNLINTSLNDGCILNNYLSQITVENCVFKDMHESLSRIPEKAIYVNCMCNCNLSDIITYEDSPKYITFDVNVAICNKISCVCKKSLFNIRVMCSLFVLYK